MNIELELKKLIKNVLNDLDLEEDIIIEIPKDRSNGDYSSNVAMKCCKKLGKSPIEIANLVKDNISSDLIESIEIKNPGFINFFVNKTYLFEELKEIIKLENNYGKNNLGEHKKVNIEFVSVCCTAFFQFKNLCEILLLYIIDVVEFIFLSVIFFVVPAIFS